MDVMTTYLYGSLDADIYMNIPETFKSNDCNLYAIKLQRSLYDLKQSGRIWYDSLNEYLIKEKYVNNLICPCVFIKKTWSKFTIIVVYIDDMNLIKTPEELLKTKFY